MRITLLGNAGSGKSTLARKIAQFHALPLVEIDTLLWQDGWVQTPDDIFAAQHHEHLAGDRWVIDGMGPLPTLSDRLSRATHVILCDLPLWQNHWLVSERYAAWRMGTLDHPPGAQATPPSSELVHRLIARVERDWMPTLRQMVDDVRVDTQVFVLPGFEDVRDFDVAKLGSA